MNICFKKLYKVASILDLVDCTAKAIKIRKVNSQTFSAKLNYNAFHLMKKKSSSNKKHKVVKLNAIDVVSNEEKDVRMFKLQAKIISKENAECEMRNEVEMVSSLVVESKSKENAECEMRNEVEMVSSLVVESKSKENAECEMRNEVEMVSPLVVESKSKENAECEMRNEVEMVIPLVVESKSKLKSKEHCRATKIDEYYDSIENRENIVGNQKNISVSDSLQGNKEYDESCKLNLVKTCLPIIVEDYFVSEDMEKGNIIFLKKINLS